MALSALANRARIFVSVYKIIKVNDPYQASKAREMDDHYVKTEYNNYWETMKYYDELDSWGFDETLSCDNNSGSPEKSRDVATTSSAVPAQETIDIENKRRRKINDSLYTLRSLVPSISKMDKASIVKDAVDYVQELQKEEKRLIADIAKLDNAKEKQAIIQEEAQTEKVYPVARSLRRSFIEVIELRVCDAGNKTLVVSMNCTKKGDTVSNLCKLFQSLNLNVLSFNMTSICGNLLHTQIVEADDMNSIQLKEKIEAAIADYEAMTTVIN